MLPLWSAAIDPRVLSATVETTADAATSRLNLLSESARYAPGPSETHLVIDRGGAPVRLDVIGDIKDGAVLRFDLRSDHRLAHRLEALHDLYAPLPGRRRFPQLARKLAALQAAELNVWGCSLRECADLILGSGDWPGDGDHRKSKIRRLVAAGMAMITAGPRQILVL